MIMLMSDDDDPVEQNRNQFAIREWLRVIEGGRGGGVVEEEAEPEGG